MVNRKETYGVFKRFVDNFIEADIPVAEVQFDEKINYTKPYTITTRINKAIRSMDLKDIIKAITIDGKIYIVNYPLLEEV